MGVTSLIIEVTTNQN